MRIPRVFGLLVAVALGIGAQDANQSASLSSNVEYPRLPQVARIQGDVIVLLSKGPAGVLKPETTGHPLLIAGIKADADHWNEWAKLGITQIDYTFKLGDAIIVKTLTEVPRNRLIRLIPWARKTRMQEHHEWQHRPSGGSREITVFGTTLRITLTLDPLPLMIEASA